MNNNQYNTVTGTTISTSPNTNIAASPIWIAPTTTTITAPNIPYVSTNGNAWTFTTNTNRPSYAVF